MPLKIKMDWGPSWVRSSGPATFFRGHWSRNHFYGHYFPGADYSRAVVKYYWRKDMHLGSLPRSSAVRLTDLLDMTIVVDWDVKPQNKTKINKLLTFLEMTPSFRGVSARNFAEKLREFSRRKKRSARFYANLAEFSPRKFAFKNFCSQCEREKRVFFLGLICI